jgi:ParB family transcriptional regulator, chromosome partitioning protein
MDNLISVDGVDIPIDKLEPLNQRSINLKTNRGFHKILSSIRSIGLIEPLCVYGENSHFVILDGFLRYKACEQLGIKSIPCIAYPTKEAYTFNRMVNRLSHYQESCMLRKSLETIDHSTIEKVLGIQSLKYRLGTEIYEHLHPDVIRMIDSNKISRKCAAELVYVNPDRQLEILREMKKCNDYSVSVGRALVIKTPPEQRNIKKKSKKTWVENPEKKQELVGKLEEVQKRHDFFASLYRQYTTDLLRLCIYVRKLINNQKIREYMATKFPELLSRFDKIVFECDGKKAM